MREIMAMAGKDLKLLARDKAGFFFTLFFPLIFAVFFGSIFSGGGGSSGLAILLVDEDGTAASARYAAKLEQASELRVTRAEREQAVDRVRRGQTVAYIVLLKGFGEANIFSGSPPKIELGVDPSRGAEAGLLHGVLTKYAAEEMSDLFAQPGRMNPLIDQSLADIRSDPNMSPEDRQSLESFLGHLSEFMQSMPETGEGQQGFSGFTPLEIETADVAVERIGPKNPYEISFPQGVIWGVMACAAAFGISLVTERTKGTLVRLRMAPVSRASILAGKATACLTAILGISVALYVLAGVVFGVRPHSVALLGAAVVSVAVCFVGVMMLLSVLGRTEQAAGGIGWAILLGMAMLGGGMIPLFAMPPWMQNLSSVSPVKWSILAMEGAVWRGFSASEMLMPCAILIGFGAVCFGAGVQAFKWTGR